MGNLGFGVGHRQSATASNATIDYPLPISLC